jgi:4-cresol dehydrogenase (hydroxylating) cytochrome subunit
MTRKRVLVAGLTATILAAGFPALASLAADTARPPQKVWDAVCAACHTAGPGPAILGMHIPADRVKAVIRNGGLEMPPISVDQVSDDELDAIADWVSAHDKPAGQ